MTTARPASTSRARHSICSIAAIGTRRPSFRSGLETDTKLLAEDAQGGRRWRPRPSDRKDDPSGLVHVHAAGMEGPRPGDCGRFRIPRIGRGRRVRDHQPHARRYTMDRRLHPRQRTGQVLPLRSQGQEGPLPLQQPRRSGRLRTGQDAPRRHRCPRRAQSGCLPVASGRAPMPMATAGRSGRCR